MPKCKRFGWLDGMPVSSVISLGLDEYEAIRLIDMEGLTQEECSEQMNVARTTIQSIYSSARKKLARSLVTGAELYIDGGEYEICAQRHPGCGGHGKCHRHHGKGKH